MAGIGEGQGYHSVPAHMINTKWPEMVVLVGLKIHWEPCQWKDIENQYQVTVRAKQVLRPSMSSKYERRDYGCEWRSQVSLKSTEVLATHRGREKDSLPKRTSVLQCLLALETRGI